MIGDSMRRTTSLPEVEVFTVVHGGGEVTSGTSRALLVAARMWVVDGSSEARRRVDVWAPPGQHCLQGCMAVMSLFGVAIFEHFQHGSNVVAHLAAAGIPVRHRTGRAAAVTKAELDALLSGWPLRYI